MLDMIGRNTMPYEVKEKRGSTQICRVKSDAAAPHGNLYTEVKVPIAGGNTLSPSMDSVPLECW